MRVAYFDCFSGASGDMILGALLDAGCPESSLREGLAALRLSDAEIEISKIRKQGFAATRFTVRTSAPPGHRHLHHIRQVIDAGGLAPAVRDRAMRIFTRLAEAEAAVHGSSVEKVHFHEVGAADAIMDIVGAALAVELLGIERVVCSPIPTGSGTVRCEHGTMPVPAPGTAELLRGVPLAACDEAGELTTPTGAAILTTLAAAYGALPAMRLERIGYGAGTRDGATRPNVLRVMLGEAALPESAETDHVIVLEANIDDATGQELGHAQERLLAAGALDVFTTAIGMKKLRTGVLLSVLAAPENADALEDVLFRETTTFGVRRSTCRRSKLAREVVTAQTRYGPIGLKIGRRRGVVLTVSPEYEDCVRAARQHGASLRDVLYAARAAWTE